MAKIVPGQKYADLGQYDKFDDYKEMITFLKDLGNTYRESKQEYEAENIGAMTMLNSLIPNANSPDKMQHLKDSLEKNVDFTFESDNAQYNVLRDTLDFNISDKADKMSNLNRNLSTWMNKVTSSKNSLGLSILNSTPDNLINIWEENKALEDRGEGYILGLTNEMGELASVGEQFMGLYGNANPNYKIDYFDAEGNKTQATVGDIKRNMKRYKQTLDGMVYGALEDRILTREEAMALSSITGEGKGDVEKAFYGKREKMFNMFKNQYDNAVSGYSKDVRLLAKATEGGSWASDILQSIQDEDGNVQNNLTPKGKQAIQSLANNPGVIELYPIGDLSQFLSKEEMAGQIERDIIAGAVNAGDINFLTNGLLLTHLDVKANAEKGLDAWGYKNYYTYEATVEEQERVEKELAALIQKKKEEAEQEKTEFQINIQKTLPAIGEFGIATPGETDEEAARRLNLETGVTEAEGERYPVSSGETEQEAIDRAAYDAGAVSEGETTEERKDRLTPKYDSIYDIDKRIGMKPLRDPLSTDSSELGKKSGLLETFRNQSDIIDSQRNIDKKEVSKVQEDFNVEIDNPTETAEYANKSSQFVSEGAEMASAGEDYDWGNLSDLWDMTPSEAKVAGGAYLLSKTPEIIKSTAYTAQHLHSQLRLPKDIINNILTDDKIAKIGKSVEKHAKEIKNLEEAMKGPIKGRPVGVTQSKLDKLKDAQKHRIKGIINYLSKKYPNANKVHLERAFDMRNKTTWNYFKLKQNVIDKFGKAGRAIFTHKYSPTQLSGKSGGIYMAYNTGFALSNWASNIFTGEDASTSVNRVTGLSTVGLTYKLYNIMSTPAGKAAFKKFLYKSLTKKAATTIGSAIVSGPFAVAIALASAGMLGYDVYNFISNYDEEKGVVSNLKEQGYVAETEVGY